MKRILWGGLLLLLAACGTSQPDLPQATNTFNFSVDPAAGSVEFAAAPGGALTAQAEDGSRVLVPDVDLSLEDYTFAFLPGNVLAIDANFRNVSGKTLKNLTFSRAAGSSGVVSSTEPDTVETLAPGESTGPLRFTVTHKGQPFTYEIEADATVADAGGVECNDPVVIPDDVLRQNIRDALNKPEGDITCADMASLTELTVDGVEDDIDFSYAGNFEGLQFAVNLTKLFLRSGRFPTGILEPISGLTKLTDLTLVANGENAPVDLGVLSNLTNLTKFKLDYTLEFSGGLVVDFTPLSGLTKLTELELPYTMTSDLTPLANLVNLTTLNLRGYSDDGSIRDLEPLSGLTKLVTLRLDNNRISDIGPLVENEGLGNNDDFIGLSLNCLDLSEGSQASQDVDTIESRNPNVQNVFVERQRSGEDEGCVQPPPPPAEDCTDPVDIPDDVLRQNIRDALNKPEGDITCVDLASLTRLFVTGISSPGGDEILDYASNFEGLQYATNLTFLLLGSDSFPTGRLSPIADLENLTTFRLFSVINRSPDLTVLSNLTDLTEFSLSTRPGGSEYNGPLRVDDLSPLSGLSKLTELRFGDVAVSDISPLSNLTNLVLLNISNSQGDGTLANIKPLASLTKLVALNLPSNQVRDLEPLSGLTNLAYLDLTTNLVLDLTPLVQNKQLGDGTAVITLYQNCLAKNETVTSQARADVDTIEGRNPTVKNVFVDLDNPDDYNPSCD